MRSATIGLEVWQPGGWEDIAQVQFAKPKEGLLGPVRFEYSSQYVVEHGVLDRGELNLPLGCQASTHLTGGLFSTHTGIKVAAVMRDMIPSGWARREILKGMGTRKDPGPSVDYLLLNQATRFPIGRLRVKNVDDGGQGKHAQKFSFGDISYYGPGMVHQVNEKPLGAGLGAGGDSPKLLIVETEKGDLFLDGAEGDECISRRWLVKWPRGKALKIDYEILRAEFLGMRALREKGFNVPLVHWNESPKGKSSLWVERFDQDKAGARFYVESAYSLLKMIGDGARLVHEEILSAVLPLAENRDEFLVEYLIRDQVNQMIGNCDNHGRNLSVLRDDKGIRLAPIYDMAPMVLDPEGLSWATTWRGNGAPMQVIETLGRDVEKAREAFKERRALVPAEYLTRLRSLKAM